MEIIIQSLGFTAGEALEQFVKERLEKFDKESKIIRANVTLSIGPETETNRYCCEIRLEVPGNDLFVKKNSEAFEKSLISAADALQRSVRRSKEKLINRRQQGPTEK